MSGLAKEARGLPLTGPFHELVQKRVALGPAFREALLREGADAPQTGDVDTGKVILRDSVKGPLAGHRYRGGAI